MEYRSYWKGSNTQDLRFGQEGIAFKASGHHDVESAEYLAWLFQPNGREEAFYCEYNELELIEEDGLNGYPMGTIGAETR